MIFSGKGYLGGGAVCGENVCELDRLAPIEGP